jgi:WD40 repeat protein
VCSVAFSPNDQHILSASLDHSVKLWNVSTGNGSEFTLLNIDRNWPTPEITAAFSRSGRYILVGGPGADPAQLFEKVTGKVALKFEDQPYCSSFFVLSNDDKYALSYGFESLVLWDATTGKIIQTLVGDSTRAIRVEWVGFTADGKQVVSLDEASRLRRWELATGKLLWEFEDDDVGRIATAVIGPDGQSLLVATFQPGGELDPLKKGEFRLLNSKGKALRTFRGHRDCIYSLSVSGDGKCILSASADQTSKVWDAATGNLLRTFEGSKKESVHLTCLSYDGKLAVARYPLDGVWDVTQGNMLWAIKDSGEVRSATFSRDGSLLVTLGNAAKVWKAVTGKLVCEVHSELISSQAFWLTGTFSPSGKEVLIANDQGCLQLRGVSTGKRIKSFISKRPPASTYAVDFSPDGRLIVTGGDADALQVWDVNTGREVGWFQHLEKK